MKKRNAVLSKIRMCFQSPFKEKSLGKRTSPSDSNRRLADIFIKAEDFLLGVALGGDHLCTDVPLAISKWVKANVSWIKLK